MLAQGRPVPSGNSSLLSAEQESAGRGFYGETDEDRRQMPRGKQRLSRFERILGSAIFIFTWSFLVLYPLVLVLASCCQGLF